MEINTVLSGKIEYLRLHFYQLCKYIMNSDLLSIKTVEPASINQINNNIANNYIDVIIGNIWEIIYDHYTEIHRYYHTFNHIYDLIKLAKEYEVYIVDKHAVYLSIYFHDIIYNPKSNTNEEDSMKLFQELCSIYINNDILINKVSQYILETKLHNVFDSLDNDLKIFIDLDMSILGCNTTISYLEYAKQIRNEYIHVDHLQYCHGTCI